jgi:hypothetical protein
MKLAIQILCTLASVIAAGCAKGDVCFRLSDCATGSVCSAGACVLASPPSEAGEPATTTDEDTGISLESVDAGEDGDSSVDTAQPSDDSSEDGGDSSPDTVEAAVSDDGG